MKSQSDQEKLYMDTEGKSNFAKVFKNKKYKLSELNYSWYYYCKNGEKIRF